MEELKGIRLTADALPRSYGPKGHTRHWFALAHHREGALVPSHRRQSLSRCLSHPRTCIKGKRASPVLRTLDAEPWGVSETASATAAPKGRHKSTTRPPENPRAFPLSYEHVTLFSKQQA